MLDKYYTRPEIAYRCCEIIKEYIDIDTKRDLVIEPSAGDGSFIAPIKDVLRCKNTIFYDIAPQHKIIKKQDFLRLSSPLPNDVNKIHVVGNPPFGFRSSTAIKFIRKAGTFCDTISFILPRSFKKPSMQRSVCPNFRLLCTYVLPKYSFTVDGRPYDVPCVFQIWKKTGNTRKRHAILRPIGYKFVKNDLNKAHFAVRRVGFNAGKIYLKDLKAFSNLNKNSHYFIRLDHRADITRIKDIKSTSKRDVSGPYSISKAEIIRKLNRYLQVQKIQF